MSLLDLCVTGLATWRLASLLAREEGPYKVLGRLRYLAGVRYDEHSISYGATEVGRLLACLWCLSVWLAPLAIALLRHCPWAARILAVSAVAIAVDRLAGGE